ncbi:4408_t:CDS:1, partial [Paraglomus occultum]
MSKFPQTVFKVFQQYGLTVTSKIIDYLKDVFEEKEVPQEEWIESLSNIAEEYQSDLLPKLVDLDNLDKLIKRLQDTALDATVEDEIMLDAQTESNQPTQLSQQLYREDNITDLEVDPRKFFHIHNIFDINNYKLFDDKETITMRLKERRDLIRKKIMHKEELERNGPK